jgi:hypothetical protein
LTKFFLFFFKKKKNAYAQWTLSTNPSGPPRPAILFIPTQHNTLVGVAFPLTGIPDFSANLSPAAAAGMTNPALIMEQLQRLPPEQQKQAIAMVRQRQLRARAQGQLQPQLPLQPQPQPQPPPQLPMDMNLNMSFMSANPSPMSSSALTGLFGGGQQQQSVGALPPQALSGSGVAQGSSGGMVNVSYEMLQSFMQRNVNADGSGILPTWEFFQSGYKYSLVFRLKTTFFFILSAREKASSNLGKGMGIETFNSLYCYWLVCRKCTSIVCMSWLMSAECWMNHRFLESSRDLLG